MLVIPGAAERRPGIQAPTGTFWIPAFAGMTVKNLIIEYKQKKKNITCYPFCAMLPLRGK